MVEGLFVGERIRLNHYTGNVEGKLMEIIPCDIAEKTEKNPEGIVQDLSRIRIKLDNPQSPWVQEQEYLLSDFKEFNGRGLEAISFMGEYVLLSQNGGNLI